jgi:L-threonylcarbamoyladenylate synthase
MDTIIGKEELLEEAGSLIRAGQLVAFPTETVYGLGADATNEKAVASIFEAKGRPQDNPLIVHIASADELKNVAREVPESAYELMSIFSPGPLTIVLKKQNGIPKITTGGLDTVGIRIPDHPLALKLIRSAGVPVAAPSANRSGRISPTEAEHVYEDMRGRIPMILDGGKTRVGIESTVLDLTKETPIILRPGAVTAEMLAPFLGKVKTKGGEVLVAEAPGMKYRHYAPVCPASGVKDARTAKEIYNRQLSAGRHPVIIAGEELLRDVPGQYAVLSLGSSPESAMGSLFSSLRKAEKVYDFILLQWFDAEEYASLQNRIEKACGGNCF